MQQNFSIRLDLQKLQNAFLRKFTGRTATKTCICIPIEDNPALFLGEKGTYLNLTANALQEQSQYGDTHYVRGDIPREQYDRMTDEQRRSFPILGNMRPIVPRQQAVAQTTDMNAPEEQQMDDLPF